MLNVISRSQDAAREQFAEKMEHFVALLKCLFSCDAFFGHTVHATSLTRHILSLGSAVSS